MCNHIGAFHCLFVFKRIVTRLSIRCYSLKTSENFEIYFLSLHNDVSHV